jgi:hypothetical protein
MKLSENTITILNNFSGINANLWFNEGNKLKTIADQRNIFAKVELEDEFPQEFGIYDMKQFLGVMNLVQEPALDFEDKYLTVMNEAENIKIKYFYSSKDHLTTEDKDFKMPHAEVSFMLNASDLERIRQAAGTLRCDTVVIQSHTEDSVQIVVTDVDNPTGNEYTLTVPAEFDDKTSFEASFQFVIRIGSLSKLYPADYIVNASSKFIASFKCQDGDIPIEYFLAMDSNKSKYGE